MSNEIQKKIDVDFSFIANDMEKINQLCKQLMNTKHYSSLGIEGICAIIHKAKSLNMTVMDALNGGLYYISGKVGMSAETMNSLIRKAGHSITKDPKSDHTKCILYGKRSDNGDTWVSVFTIDEAKKAGLVRNVFDKYPAAMLYNRAMSFLARQLFPDVISGAGYTKEELEEIEYTDVTPKVNETMQEKISEEQVTELSAMLSVCDPDVVKKFQKFIKNVPICANSIEEIPLSQYEGILGIVKKRYAEAMEKMKVEEISEEEPDTSFNVVELEESEND